MAGGEGGGDGGGGEGGCDGGGGDGGGHVMKYVFQRFVSVLLATIAPYTSRAYVTVVAVFSYQPKPVQVASFSQRRRASACVMYSRPSHVEPWHVDEATSPPLGAPQHVPQRRLGHVPPHPPPDSKG